MWRSKIAISLFLSAVAVAQTASKTAGGIKARAPVVEDWPVWGGKNRDFIVNTSGLADSWPSSGPPKIWTRPLGDGYSAIAEENGVLYTAFRRSGAEVIAALDAATGKTLWEYGYPTVFINDFKEKVGPGPYAMPQVIGDRVVTASAIGKIHSLDKKTGKVVWSHDLYNEFHASHLVYGYSCHALPYKDTLIFLAGGSGDAAIALRQSDGTVVWKSLQFSNAYSSPLLINVDGQQQVVAVGAKTIFGFSPDNGQLYWSHPHETQYGLAVSTPVWGPGNLLFAASAYGLGARVVELHQAGGKNSVKELWSDPHLELHWGSVIQRDGWLYFVSGYNGPALLSAVEMKTGKIGWRQRGFAKAELLWADGKFILADEDGTLALCRMSPEKLEVLSKAQVLESIAWSPPTLVGTRLYLRDRKNIVALDLGAK
ncbi:MAG TPA: PQQ-binding-like beta-propeller repeat protein [Bryobacteraceae bacterium]|nr:PQQ-binding-like beta-propeller repeat protein [Bryobacteraceae bacterium]